MKATSTSYERALYHAEHVRGLRRGAARAVRPPSAGLDPPLALVDLDAFDRNAHDLPRGRPPDRVATKSLRCRYLIERALAMPGYRGVDVLLAARGPLATRRGHQRRPAGRLPDGGRQALRSLAADDGARRHITIMVDSPAHLDMVDRALGDGHAEIRVCLELDVCWRPLGRRPVSTSAPGAPRCTRRTRPWGSPARSSAGRDSAWSA